MPRLYLVPAPAATAPLPDGGTIVVPACGPGRYVPVRASEAVDGAAPRRLHFYAQRPGGGYELDPLAIEYVADVDGVAHYHVSGTIGRVDAGQILGRRLAKVERSLDALRGDSRKREALKAARVRTLKNSRGVPVAVLPTWCGAGQNPRTLATDGEDPETMEELPDLEEARS